MTEQTQAPSSKSPLKRIKTTIITDPSKQKDLIRLLDLGRFDLRRIEELGGPNDCTNPQDEELDDHHDPRLIVIERDAELTEKQANNEMNNIVIQRVSDDRYQVFDLATAGRKLHLEAS